MHVLTRRADGQARRLQLMFDARRLVRVAWNRLAARSGIRHGRARPTASRSLARELGGGYQQRQRRQPLRAHPAVDQLSAAQGEADTRVRPWAPGRAVYRRRHYGSSTARLTGDLPGRWSVVHSGTSLGLSWRTRMRCAGRHKRGHRCSSRRDVEQRAAADQSANRWSGPRGTLDRPRSPRANSRQAHSSDLAG